MVFETSRQSSEVPGVWKKGNFVPIFQKGRMEDPRNCWTVSLSSVPGKIMPGTDPLRTSAGAHGGKGADLRQPAWLHHGNVEWGTSWRGLIILSLTYITRKGSNFFNLLASDKLFPLNIELQSWNKLQYCKLTSTQRQMTDSHLSEFSTYLFELMSCH